MIPVTPHFKYITNLLNRVLLIMGMGILSAGFLSCRSSGSKINGGSDTMIRYSIPEPLLSTVPKAFACRWPVNPGTTPC
ncbi:MAG: hypothetical protein IPP31_12870 [Chitinophagaceae bacterium]|nr:hypothetical protein [Chitinophagaceae bacterium]